MSQAKPEAPEDQPAAASHPPLSAAELRWLRAAVWLFFAAVVGANLFEVMRSGAGRLPEYLFSIRHPVRAGFGLAMVASAAVAAFLGPDVARAERWVAAAAVLAIAYFLPKVSFWVCLLVVLRGGQRLCGSGSRGGDGPAAAEAGPATAEASAADGSPEAEPAAEAPEDPGAATSAEEAPEATRPKASRRPAGGARWRRGGR